MITYDITYEINTEESAMHGEAAESGYLDHGLTSDFHDMASILEGTEPSQYPLSADATSVWFTRHDDADMYTGEQESVSYHPATSRDCRYMIKAWLARNAH